MDESTMNGAPIHAPGGEPGTDPNGDGPKLGVPGVSVTLQREQSSANAHNAASHPPHAPDSGGDIADDRSEGMPLYLA